MKKTLQLILFLLISLVNYSQVTSKDAESETQTLRDGRYVFTQSVSFKETAPSADTEHTFTFDIIKSTTVIVHSSDDTYIYFKKDPEMSFEIYAVKRDDFFFYTKQIFQKFKGAEAGIYTIPFRLRGSGEDFDFETNLSLQANIVFGFGSRNSQVSIFDASVGIGLSSIALNEKNSKVTENRTASALTLSIGGVIKPTSRANIGLFLGGDFLGRNDRNVDWKYDKNLWLGVGVNISFNKLETTKPAEYTSNSDENNLEDNINKFIASADADIKKAVSTLSTAESIKSANSGNSTKADAADADILKAKNAKERSEVLKAFAESEKMRIEKGK